MTLILKNSAVFRLLMVLAASFRFSLIRAMIEGTAVMTVESRTGALLARFFDKPWQPMQSLLVRLSMSVRGRFESAAEAFAQSVAESRAVRAVSSSLLARLLVRHFVDFAAFYVFIDEVGRTVLGESTLVGYWDEAFLLMCVVWVVVDHLGFRSTAARQTPFRTMASPVDAPMLLLIGTAFLLMLNFARHPLVAVDGFRVVVQYLLFFFVFSRYLTTGDRADSLERFMLTSGAALALHGVWQIVTGVQSPASWTDQAEGNVGSRAFSIVESPNILGSIMVLLIPLALAHVLKPQKRIATRIFWLCIAGAMGLCVLFTLSRGAWLSLVFAMAVFCLCVNPRWLLILGGGGVAALMIPQVYSRFSYLFTAQFLASSMRGGRYLRYQTGLRMFMENLWTGVGLGHFGGATAMNNKNLFPDTFYMDNYWLKTMVETGIPGIACFALLIGFLVVWCIRAIRRSAGTNRLLVSGAFAGLCGVILHNGLENIFEVPYMVVYFWLVAALALYRGYGLNRDAEDS